jgi:hypothetical protein
MSTIVDLPGAASCGSFGSFHRRDKDLNMSKRLRIAGALVGAAALTFSAGAALAAAAGGVSGDWAGEVKLPNGMALPFVAHYQQSGATLTGKMDGIRGAPDVPIQEGKVSGDSFTYVGVRQINNMPVKFNYSGKLAGDAIDLDIMQADGKGAPLKTHLTRKAD